MAIFNHVGYMENLMEVASLIKPIHTEVHPVSDLADPMIEAKGEKIQKNESRSAKCACALNKH